MREGAARRVLVCRQRTVARREFCSSTTERVSRPPMTRITNRAQCWRTSSGRSPDRNAAIVAAFVGLERSISAMADGRVEESKSHSQSFPEIGFSPFPGACSGGAPRDGGGGSAGPSPAPTAGALSRFVEVPERRAQPSLVAHQHFPLRDRCSQTSNPFLADEVGSCTVDRVVINS